MKRSLALVLALVMVIGMMAVPASAAFTDAADVQYVEAVDVVAACGIIEGYNNEFNPKGELTRAAGAKLVAYLELGAKRAEALTAEKAPFADVPADHWAAGYIGWAVGKGYIAGVGDNKFAPDAPLSAVAYAKLLLCALGYDASVEGYTGAGYEFNIIEDAIDAKLFEGNDDIDYAAVCTREEAALYTFNALNTIPVKYNGGTGTKVEINGAVIATGAGKLENDGADTMAKKLYTKLEKTTDKSDAFGRPATTWKYNKEKVGTYAETPVVTYTAATKASVIKADLKDYTVWTSGGADAKVLTKVQTEVASSVTSQDIDSAEIVKVNGVASGVDKDLTADGSTVKTLADAIAAETKNGRLVEVYADDDDMITAIVVVDTYVGIVDAWTEANEAKEQKEEITVGESYGDLTLTTATFETTAYEKADAKSGEETVILFTQADGVVKSVATAEYAEDVTVSGYKSAEAVKDAYAILDGTTTKYSEKYGSTSALSYTMNDADVSYTFYFDTYGNIIADELYAGSENEDYFLVRDVATEVKSDGDFASAKSYFSYKLVGMDGKVVTVKAIDANSSADFAIHDIVTYEADDDNEGYVVITKVTSGDGYKYSEVTSLKKDAPALFSGAVATNETIFVLQEGSTTAKNEWNVYTGIKNVPEYVLTGGNNRRANVVVDSNNYAEVVYINFGGVDGADSSDDEVIYLFSDTKSDLRYDAENDCNYYVVKAIVGGEKTTINVATSTTLYAGLVKVTAYNADGYVKTVVAVDTSEDGDFTDKYEIRSIADAAELKYSAPVATIDSLSFVIADDAVVYFIDSDDNVTVGDAADLAFTADGAGTAYLAFKAADNTTVTTVYYDGNIK